MLSELSDFARHAAGVRDFVRTPLTDGECLARIERGIATRGQAFLERVEHGVFRRPGSPYARLFAHAGVEFEDVRRLVESDGLEATLEGLCDAGIYVSIAEFRGDAPIERNGLSFTVRDTDFDNPLTPGTWSTSTGGSRSLGRRILLNAEHLEQSGVYYALFLMAHDAAGRPEAVWRPFPTRTAVNNVLRSAKQRRPIEKWFSQTRVLERHARPGDAALAAYALIACRVWASPLPMPEHVPYAAAIKVARWLEAKARAGTPALLSAPVGTTSRVCVAAKHHGADIAGTLFRGGGEPLTPARAELIESTGSRVFADYSMAELGRVGVSCAAPNAVGDVHFLLDKLVLVQRPHVVPMTGETVGSLFFTTLLPSAPKLMINVETDDYAVVEDRACGCLLGRLGFSRHLHGIRSYEKLTSEGVTLRGADVLSLLEGTLPERFGGAPSDYQLVQELDELVPTLVLLVSPQVGAVDEREVVEVVLAALSNKGAQPQEASRTWRNADTIRVERREPYATTAGKILPVHVKARRPG